MRFTRYLIFLLAAGAVQAQTTVSWDNSGNGRLKGTYYFRQVYYVIGDCNGNLSEAVTLYGGITFDGNGNYSITSANGAQVLEYSYSQGGTIAAGPYPVTGT